MARREAVQFQHVAPRKIADVRTAAAIHRTTAAAPAQPSADEAAPEARAPLLDTDDSIDRAYADERTAIMQDFARRIAGARDPGERRAIKTARKSALAAAKQKAKLLKAGRKAANMITRQSTPRRQRPGRAVAKRVQPE